MKSVLITGGSGFIGKNLADLLSENGFEIRILSSSTKTSKFPVYNWNIKTGEIDTDALKNIDYIIHLAGANIGEKRWTHKRKLEIAESRIKSAELLYKFIKNQNIRPKAFISASAIGYYGTVTTEKIFYENDVSSTDFLGKICWEWEQAALKFNTENIRTVIIRTGVVLGKKGSVLQEITKTAKFGFIAPLGSGKQYLPWIHIDDLCAIYMKAIEDNTMTGSYNAVAPENINNYNLTKKIAGSIRIPFVLPRIPAFVFKLLWGKMAGIILEGSRVSSEKIISAGFNFRYPDVKSALDNIFKNKND